MSSVCDDGLILITTVSVPQLIARVVMHVGSSPARDTKGLGYQIMYKANTS